MTGEFHSQDGLYFSRTEDGSVRVRFADTPRSDGGSAWTTVVLDSGTWASVVAHVGVSGETVNAFAAALKFHTAGPPAVL